MPGGDRMGPSGAGPRTGRGLGYCAGYSSPGYFKGPGGYRGYPYGRGMAWRGSYGRGRRGGWRGPYYPETIYVSQPITHPIYYGTDPSTPVNQLGMLKQEKDFLESELNQIKNSIEEISKKIEELEKEE